MTCSEPDSVVFLKKSVTWVPFVPSRATLCALNPSLSNGLCLYLLSFFLPFFLCEHLGFKSGLFLFLFSALFSSSLTKLRCDGKLGVPSQRSELQTGCCRSVELCSRFPWGLRLPIGSLKLPCVCLGPLLHLEGWFLLLVRGPSQGTL